MIRSLVASSNGKVIHPGDTLRVEINFDYQSPADTSVTVWAWLALMQLPKPVGRDIENFTILEIPKSFITRTWGTGEGEGFVDIPIPTGGKENGIYQLGVELMNTGIEEKIDNAVELTGMPEAVSTWGLIAEMMPLLMIMMMFAMLTPMTRELGQGSEY